MLLRRTRADAVAKVWPRFLARFPSAADVMEAVDDCRETLRPLGLNWRAENLIDVARELVDHHDGVVPETRVELLALPGVGQYVADAVLAFAHGERTVLVDSNTARIAFRVIGDPGDWSSLRSARVRKRIEELTGNDPPAPDLNLALLDLGGTLCVARRPRCGACPLAGLCSFGRRIPSPGRNSMSYGEGRV
jgi:A/G-specific adenine glycosylase